MPGLTASAGFAGLLARATGDKPRELTDAVVRPGWLGLLVFIALAAACYFLFRSMNRQLKKVDFVEEPPDARAPSRDEEIPEG